jgi:hypothetical protein
VDERQIFILADQALMTAFERVKPGQWQLDIPEWFQTRRDQNQIDLRGVAGYHAYDEAWVPDTLAGRTIAEVGDRYAGDLLGDDPAAGYRRLMELAIPAVEGLTDLDQPVHLTYGDYPAREYLWHISTFRGLRSYEINKLIGADTTMPPELVQGLWSIIEPHAEEWRQIGVFGPALEPTADSPQARLLALTGRPV